MSFATWPTDLPDPEAPFSGDLIKPVDFSSTNNIGAFISRRRFTRAVVKGSATLYLDLNSDPELTKFNILREFWRITLNDGQAYFHAVWSEYLGYKGYVFRMPTFPISMTGSMPTL